MNLHYYFLFQGRHATQDEIAASAFQAVDLDQKYGGEPVQVRITMGKEPRHFMAVFKGKMVIFEVRRLTVFIIISSEIFSLFSFRILIIILRFLAGIYSCYNCAQYFFLSGGNI